MIHSTRGIQTDPESQPESSDDFAAKQPVLFLTVIWVTKLLNPYIPIYCMVKTIRVSEEYHEWLNAHKRDDETFSDVVLRLAGERSLLELAGVLSDDEADALREAVEERRDRRAAELEDTADRLREA